jgi:hypothetical protein
MLYRILRGITQIYAPVWFAIFVLLAAIAFVCTMIYPLVSIVLLISSVFLVVIVRCGYLGLKWVELWLAREALGEGRCPACSTKCDAVRVGEQRVHECPGCRGIFDERGEHFAPPPADELNQASFERTALAGELP